MPRPTDFGLEHDAFRPHQYETIEWALDGPPIKVLEAPTGSGKTAIARAVSSRYRTLALVRTKALQEDNYERGYDFIPLYGRANYECVYPHNTPGAHADQCMFAEEGMTACPQYSVCPYVQQRELAKYANRTALNYAYWLYSYLKWPAPEYMVLDEAHELSNITLEWAGCTINDKDREEWELPLFPMLRTTSSGSIMHQIASVEDRAAAWLTQAAAKVEEARAFFARNTEIEQMRKQARKAELFAKKIKATLDALESSPNDWYIRSGPNVLPNNKESSWAFVCRPLTARHHFPQYFMLKNCPMMMMSATIGDAQTFCNELGIQEASTRKVASPWPTESRPIYALDVPRLGQKSDDAAWQKQADEIAKLIKDCPKNWNGIVHVTAINEATRLATRLAQRGLEDRVYVAQRAPTNKMVADWQMRMKRVPGSLLISWALWEGYNGLDEKINIAAKVPYPYLGDPYEVERRNYNGSFFLQRAAWQLEQGLGRTRRGRSEDYDTPTEKRGMVAVADGGWKWLRKYLSPAFVDSICI